MLILAGIHKFMSFLRKEKEKIDIKISLASGKYINYAFTEPDKIGKPFCVFKPETTETIKLMRVYGFIENGEFTINYPEIKLWIFENVSVFGRNDFIIKDQKVYWPKMYNYNFNKNIPHDYNLISYDNQNVIIREEKKNSIIDVAFSLIGVHAQIWSHSISEYYTKISMLASVLNREKNIITVLVPDYKDQQLKKIIYDALSKYDKIVIRPVEDGEKISVKKLYFMERPAAFTDHETYVAIGDNAQPKIISDIINNNLVCPLTRNAKDDLYPKKIFLPRRGKYRALTNNEEIELFFKEQGYYMLEPHKVTLEEKVKFFYNADVIVGSFSSAFSNLIFSKPGTKVILFSNYQRIFESWLAMHYQYFKIDMLFVTGQDLMKENSAHSNFYIPLDRIKSACHDLNIQFD